MNSYIISQHQHGDDALVLQLEVSRGQTQFPLRPVTDHFAIGSDPGCDLQLGGEEIPPLHSVIHADGDGMCLETVGSHPPLKVNGQPATCVNLQDGDVIEIGAFQFVARFAAAPADFNGAPPHAATADILDLSEQVLEDETPLSELTAEELIDLIEQDQMLIEEFEGGRRQGAESLLREVSQRAEQIAAETAEPALPTGIPDLLALAGQSGHGDLEKILEQLADIAEALEHRAQRLARREALYADSAEQLLEAQQQLASRLETILGQLEDDRIQDRRAIA